MQLRKRLTGLLAALATTAGAVGVLTLAPDPVGAAAPAPVILNNDTPVSGNAAWLETQNLTDGGHNRIVQATFLVQHAEGRTITGVKADFNWNGTDDTPGASVIPVGSSGGHNVEVDRYTPSAGAMQTSRVVARINVGNGPNSSGRAFNAPFRMRVVDSTGEQSATVSSTIRFVEEGQSTGSQDYPSIRDIVPGTYTNRVPGQSVSYSIRCDDPDVNFFSDDDECDRANMRWRRLDDGDTIALGQFGAVEDNSTQTITTTAPSSNGHWVFEVQLCNEDGGCPTSGQGSGSNWWRLGSVAVNDSASSLSGSLSFPGAAASSPPSVNEDAAINVSASVSESGGHGAVVQVIEWNTDAHANSSFESRSYTVPSKNSSGDIVTPNISTVSGALTRAVNTSSPGLKTVQARITDNGALDAADDIRRQATLSAQLRVNALPVANDVTRTIAEDSGSTTITLNGSDPDSQPAPIVYSLVSGLSNPSLGTLGGLSGNQITFTPAANANGSTTFTYRVRDGVAGTVGANGFSNTATVTINVTPVNDLPTAHPKTLTTAEDTIGSVHLSGTDVEDGTTLSWSINPGGQATNGTASCTTAGTCTYTPDEDFHGTDSFVVRGTDSDGGVATATVSVTVTPVNDAPTAHDQSVTVPEDAVGAPITLTGSDVDNPVLNATAPLDDVDHGTLSCLGSSCTYSPDADYHGLDSFTFRMDDGDLDSNVATVSITVSPVNDAPVATDVPDAVADEDVPTPIAATGTDVDGDPVTVSSATDPLHGTTQVSGPNEVTYTGDQHFHGVDAYEFTVVDDEDGSDTGVVSVTVLPVNDAPEVADQSFTVDEDTPTLLSIAAGDVDGDALTWSVTGSPGAGTVTGSGPDLVYSPDPDWHGTDTFTVEVHDGSGGTDSATITVAVAPVNDQPAADAVSVTTAEDTGVEVTLTASDVDGDGLTFAAPVDDAHDGTVSCAGPVCTYTPNQDFHGADLFTFSVSDGQGGSDFASVAVTVTSVNDAPEATGAAVATDEDDAVGVNLSATDVDGDLLTFTYGTASDGTVTGAGPNAVYAPNPNWSGTDAFGFTVSDGNGGSDSAMVSVLVQPVNDAPVGTGGTVTTAEDTDVSFSLTATDVEDDPLTFSVVTPPEHGSLSCAPDGACTFDPDDDFSGSTVVGYEVSDGDATGQGVVTILVDPVNDPPEAQVAAPLTAEDTPVSFSLTATDKDGDALTYAVVAGPATGDLVCDDGGSCTYTPAPNAFGSDTFTWEVSDGTATATSTAAVTVAPVNDAPKALDVAAETDEDTPVSFLLLASDVEGDPLTYSVELAPLHGSVTIAGSLATYTPAADYSGTDVFVYRATDPSGAFTTAQVSLVVDEVPLIGTTLQGEAAVARVLVTITGGLINGGITLFPKMAATLRSTDGEGIAGRTITFTIGGNVVCQAVTDADGAGECSGQAALASLLHLGYQVSFAGDADYAGSTARGPLIQLLNLRL